MCALYLLSDYAINNIINQSNGILDYYNNRLLQSMSSSTETSILGQSALKLWLCMYANQKMIVVSVSFLQCARTQTCCFQAPLWKHVLVKMSDLLQRGLFVCLAPSKCFLLGRNQVSWCLFLVLPLCLSYNEERRATNTHHHGNGVIKPFPSR